MALFHLVSCWFHYLWFEPSLDPIRGIVWRRHIGRFKAHFSPFIRQSEMRITHFCFWLFPFQSDWIFGVCFFFFFIFPCWHLLSARIGIDISSAVVGRNWSTGILTGCTMCRRDSQKHTNTCRNSEGWCVCNVCVSAHASEWESANRNKKHQSSCRMAVTCVWRLTFSQIFAALAGRRCATHP